MAYVSISRELVSRVRSNINRMCRAERASAAPKVMAAQNVAKDVSQLFTIGCWGPHAHLLNVIPKKEWCHPVGTADIYVNGTTEVDETTVQVRAGIRFTDLKNAWAMPKAGSYYANTKCEFSIDELRALPEEMLGRQELLEMYDEATIDAEITHRWNKIEMEMAGFLNKCKSLNEAIKLFPGVKMYVDREDINRMERKIERKPREALVIDIDTGAITAAAVAARLMGGA